MTAAIFRHRLQAVFVAVLVLALAGPAVASAGSGHMYRTDSGRVHLRLLTGDRLTSGGLSIFTRCVNADFSVKIRRGRVSYRRVQGRLGVAITGAVNARAFTGTITTWNGTRCRLSAPFTARRDY